MAELYGKQMTRRAIAEHAGTLAQFAGVRLMTLGDGQERGNRILEFRTGTGLRFTLMLDRCMDIGDCDYRGMAIGWNSAAGFKHPGLTEYEGEGGLGWLRSFSGLLATCGLDHILSMHTEDAAHFAYVGRKTVSHSIHGRASMQPARLTGYGERWEGDECILWAEGVIVQATVFGENLELHRRIEATVGTNDIRLHDRVVNAGFSPTPHMYLLHINVGHPVLAEGSRYLAPVIDCVWANHAGEAYRRQGVGYQTMPAPMQGYLEQVWQHQMQADPKGLVPVALVNDALGIGFQVETRADQFPCHLEWQNFQPGMYTIGLEPSTNHVLGHGYAREQGELIWLEHGEARDYDCRLSVLPDAAAIARGEARIRSIAVQPAEDFPPLSGLHRPLPA